MAFVMSALLVLAAVAVWVGNRLHSYPGGWAYAFARAYAAERAELAAGRSRVREVERSRAQERSAAEQEIRATEAEYRRRITELQNRVAELAEPGAGAVLESLGELTLHQHLVRYRSENIPLARLRVRLDLGSEQHRVLLTRPNGNVRRVEFSGLESDQVHEFVVRLEAAVAAEDDFLLHRDERTVKARRALELARSNTIPQQTARADRDRLLEQQREDRALREARAELTAAHNRWQHTTGHRPG
ncbi:hypothetical protein F4556_005275 [Kitasatospora gansuensis]|uniref:Uncharacterized protein n=1 Tax=Kitasatospora gansuensis TaxID=258050 RepID=A0A7W7WK80_9ACTN|nr:hypothetical protein [Kitasatospora gansuensis]MBB4949740.1 hypothetical protein [Kitasatospora gansuensis]